MLARANQGEWNMLRNLKRSAALFAGLCVLGAITASPAFAEPGEFTIGSSPAAITGGQVTQNIIEVTNTAKNFIKLKCIEASFEGTVSTASGHELTLTPTYTGCTLGGLAASVHMNGCKYTLTGSAERTATLDIVGCTEGKAITVEKGNCEITIGQQSALSHVVFVSEGTASAMDTLANVTVSKITVTQSSGSECPAPGAFQSDASYSGTVTVKAFSDSGSRSATKLEHTYTEVICGTQVSFTVD